VDGDEKVGKGLKDSSLGIAFAELAFSIMLKLSYEKLSYEKMQRGLFVRNNTEVVCRRHKKLKTSNDQNVFKQHKTKDLRFCFERRRK
jgi:hypothetical protein